MNLPFTWFSYQERKNLLHSIHAKMDIMTAKEGQILHSIAQWILISVIFVIETCRSLKRWIKKKYKIFSYKNHCRIHNLILMYIWKNRNQEDFISWYQTKTIFFSYAEAYWKFQIKTIICLRNFNKTSYLKKIILGYLFSFLKSTIRYIL